MGFGHVTDKTSATHLQFTRLVTVNLQKCITDTQSLISKNSAICADPAKGSSICTGDVGSPYVSSTFGKLLGIASYADKNCKLDHPHGFTGIAAYRQWIDGVMEGVLS